VQLANECVQTNAAERVVLKRETPCREGTTYLAMSMRAFMQRLAALATCLSRTALRCSRDVSASGCLVVPQSAQWVSLMGLSVTLTVAFLARDLGG